MTEEDRTPLPFVPPIVGKAVPSAEPLGTVMVVDDDADIRDAVRELLEQEGYAVITAADGQEALDELERNPELDAVLMDLMMPRMDGHEAIRQIRAQERFHDLPIIAITAKTMQGARERCMAAGASEYVPKPVDIGQLLGLLRTWLA